MKTIALSFFAFILFTAKISAQHDILVKEAGLNLSLPNDKWLEEKEKKHHHQKPIYHFKRTDVRTSTGKVIVPEVVVSVEHIKGYTDLTQYSIQKQKPYSTLKNYKVQKTFTESDGMLKLRYAVGTKAVYDDADGVTHTFYFIHAVKKGLGIQVIIDIPSYLFDHYEEELTSIIRSLEYKN